MRRLFMLIIALFFLSGCASIMSGRMQKITVQADPPGASILIDGGVNTSPCQQEVKRSEKHNIVAEKPGYKPCQFTPDRTMNPWVIGNILIGGIIGIIIDAASGSIVAIDQDEVRMVLYQGKDCDIFVKSRDQWVNVNKTENKEEVKTAGYRATGVQSISYTESREVKTTVADNTKIPEPNISEAKKQSLEINNDTESNTGGMKNPDNERTIQGKSEIGEPKRQQKEADPKGGGEALKSKSSEKETPGQVTSEIGHFRKISEAKFVTQKETSEQKRVEDKTIAPNSNEAKKCVNRGVAFLQKKQFEEAAQEFTKAINLDPNYKVPYYNRGLVFYSRGEYDRAIKDFSAALTLNPNDSDSYYNRGLCYNLERQTDKAKQDFQTACDLGDKDGCKKSGR